MTSSASAPSDASSAAPHMEFRPLTADELELAVALAASQAGLEVPGFEGWGLGASGGTPLNAEAFGLFVGGALAGAVWLVAHPQGIAEAAALVLSRKRWGMGLTGWMLDNAAAETGRRGLKGLFLTLSGGPESLGEKLEDAGFRGPQLADPGYPRGRWIRKV